MPSAVPAGAAMTKEELLALLTVSARIPVVCVRS
jgi:hypothetical protein